MKVSFGIGAIDAPALLARLGIIVIYYYGKGSNHERW